MSMKRTRPVVAVASVVGLLVASLAPVAGANPTSEIQQTQGFRRAVTVAGIREHQLAFQGFAELGDTQPTRVSTSPGYEASVEYVIARMTAAGYQVSTDPFQFIYNADATTPVFEQVSPAAVSYTDGVEFSSMTFSPNGDDTAPVYAVDLKIPPPPAAPGQPEANTTNSGCEASDFTGFPTGNIALVQRGTCTFAVKAQNAADAGAAAVIVMNEGQAGRTSAVAGTLGGPVTHSAQTIGTTYAIGVDLANAVVNGSGPTGTTARVSVDRINEERTSHNVIAETPGGDPNRVVVIGAHLDSVPRGPGINDNGSGSGMLLEIAETFAGQMRETRNKLRFMWYGAEEFGLLGSEAYVDELSPAQLDQIELMLNFDMVGSPNYARFVYDGDNSSFPVVPGQVQEGPPGSGEIERLFRDYFVSQFGHTALPSEPTPFSGRSDYGPFILEGIPAGGLFTGAEGGKTAAQAAVYGGIVGAQYDPCYHLACDTFEGTGDGAGATEPGLAIIALDQMSDAAAHAVLLFSKRNFDKEPLTTTAAAADVSLQRMSVGGTADAPAPASDHEEAVDR